MKALGGNLHLWLGWSTLRTRKEIFNAGFIERCMHSNNHLYSSFPTSPANHRKLLPHPRWLTIPPQLVLSSKRREEETWNKIYMFLWPAAARRRPVHSAICAAQMCCWMSLVQDWQIGSFPTTSCTFL